MANNDNSCSNLKIKDHYTVSKNTLADLMNMQKDIQEKVYGYNFKELQEGPLSGMRKFFDWNYHAIQDELREMMDALGGIKDGIGSGVWKPWKKAHKLADEYTFNKMTNSDKKELKMELVDLMHFFFNLCAAVNMTPEELFNYYMAKNEENIRRQNTGY